MFRTVVLVLLVGCCMIDHWHINILISALHDGHNFEINLVLAIHRAILLWSAHVYIQYVFFQCNICLILFESPKQPEQNI